MNSARIWGKMLLWVHLFVMVVWLCVFHSARHDNEIPFWMIEIFIISILAIQFTWGFTVGLLVGPSRKRRPLLWWSLLPIFMPVYFIRGLMFPHLFALALLAVFIMILACETYGGVLMGAKLHSESKED